MTARKRRRVADASDFDWPITVSHKRFSFQCVVL